MDKYNVLITCMGGYGAEYLADNIRRSDIGDQIRFVGTHADQYFLSTSIADAKYLVPWAKDEEHYIEETLRIIKKEKIDLFIPKSDKEVGVVSKHRDRFDCKIFLPEDKEVVAAQDKLSFYEILQKHNVGVAKTFQVNDRGQVEQIIKKLPGDKFWVRVKTPGEAGAITATWVKDAEQALKWIDLWNGLYGIDIREFTISEFLPGRLFECLLLFNSGELKLAKLYENVRFHGADQKISGMASTPGVAKTCSEEIGIRALKESVKAVEVIAKEAGSIPNGIYHLSAKYNLEGEPCLTESNSGRFPSTCAFFDRTGKYISAEFFIKYALGLPVGDLEDPFDIDDTERYIIWTLGKQLTISTSQEVADCKLPSESIEEAKVG